MSDGSGPSISSSATVGIGGDAATTGIGRVMLVSMPAVSAVGVGSKKADEVLVGAIEDACDVPEE